MLGEMLRILRVRYRLLLGAALVVFIPLGLIEILDELVREPLFEEAEEDETPDTVQIVEAVAAGLAHAAVALVGEVLYTGIVVAAVSAAREGDEHPLRHVLRTIPYGRLVAADLLLAILVAIGFVLLIVPGLVFLAWFALIAPAIETEDHRVIGAFRRSRELVRGNTWRVLALILPTILIGDVLASAVQSGAIASIGDTFLGDWIAAVAADLATSPFYALAVVVLFFELRQSSSAQTASR